MCKQVKGSVFSLDPWLISSRLYTVWHLLKLTNNTYPCGAARCECSSVRSMASSMVRITQASPEKKSAGRWHLAGLKKQLLSMLSVSAVWEEIRKTLNPFFSPSLPELNQNHRSSDLRPDFELFHSELECSGVVVFLYVFLLLLRRFCIIFNVWGFFNVCTWLGMNSELTRLVSFSQQASH